MNACVASRIYHDCDHHDAGLPGDMQSPAPALLAVRKQERLLTARLFYPVLPGPATRPGTSDRSQFQLPVFQLIQGNITYWTIHRNLLRTVIENLFC